MDGACRFWSISPAAVAPSGSRIERLWGAPASWRNAELLVEAKQEARVAVLGDEFEEVDVSKRRFVVLFVGRCEENKGISILLRAAEVICRMGGHLVVLSRPSKGQEMTWKVLKRLKTCRDKLTLVLDDGKRNVSDVRLVGDLCLVPSWSEGYGLAAAEAIHHGCLVVASDTTGLRDIARMVGSKDETCLATDVAPMPRRSHFEESDQIVLASLFKFASDQGTKHDMRRAMSSLTTTRNAIREILALKNTLLLSNATSLSYQFLDSAFRNLPTPQTAASRIRSALQGTHACDLALPSQATTHQEDILSSIYDPMRNLESTLNFDLSTFRQLYASPDGLRKYCNILQKVGFAYISKSSTITLDRSNLQPASAHFAVCFPHLVDKATVRAIVDSCLLYPGNTVYMRLNIYDGTILVDEDLTGQVSRHQNHCSSQEIVVGIDIGVPFQRIVLSFTSDGPGNAIFENIRIAY